MPIGKPLRLRLYLEGQEIPVVAAQVTAGPNAPSVASIQIIPLDEGMEFYPRTMVHLFYLDSNAVITPGSNQSTQNMDPMVSGIATDYRLLFCGEIVGFSMQQAPGERALVLQCMDFSSYWDAAHALAVEYGPGGNAFTQHANIFGGSVGTFDDIANHMQEKLMDWLGSTPQTPGLQSVGGLAGGIIRMLESMGGVPGHYKGVNDFFTAAELRVRLLSQITAEDNDNSASRILNAKVMDQWIRNGLNNIGLQVTFRDLLKLLFQYIYYEFVPNPCAKWDPAISQGKNKNVPGVTARVASSPAVQSVNQNISYAVSRISAVLNDTSTLTAAYLSSTASVILANINASIAQINSLRSSSPQFATVAAQILNALNIGKLDITPYTTGSLTDLSGYKNCQTDLLEIATIIGASGDVVVSTKSSVQSSSVTQRLRTQIIKPDCWFVAPPKCNVIFPEHYTQFSYERNYLTEVTRSLVQIYNTLIGPDALLSDYILLPNIGSATTGLVKTKGNVNSYRILMDHEIHTGIIPRHERLSNMSAVGAKTNQTNRQQVKTSRLTWSQRAGLFNFFKYRFAARQMSVTMRFNPFLVCGFPALLLRKPFLVFGANAVPSNANSSDVLAYVTNNAQQLGAPSQFLGMIASLVHNISQEGGTSSIQLHHVRKHMGVDDEFLTQFITDPTGPNMKVVKTVIRYSDIKNSPTNLKLLAGCTPQGAKASPLASTSQAGVTQVIASTPVSSVQNGQLTTQNLNFAYNVLSQSKLASPPPPPPFTIFGQITGASLNRSNILTPNPYGTIKPQSKNGYLGARGGVVLGIEVLDPTVVQDPKFGRLFSAVAIYEQVSIPLTGTSPFEEIVRPPWFSNNYANANIGSNIYSPFFGCLSIVDDLNVLGITGTTQIIENDPDSQNFSTDLSPDQIISQLQQNSNAAIQQSVQNSVNILSYVYGQIKTKNLDVDQFIRSYVERPIATKTQVLGSDDLQVTVDSAGVASATTGQIGFHSTAVNPTLVNLGNFAGLSVDPSLGLKRVDSNGQPSPLDPRLDIRLANSQKVTDYITVLGGLSSNAFIG